MKNVTVYTGPMCNFCDAAKRLFSRNNIEYQEIDISSKAGLMDEMIKKSNGRRTIPQIFFDDHHVGGYQELRALEKEQKLEDLISTNNNFNEKINNAYLYFEQNLKNDVREKILLDIIKNYEYIQKRWKDS